MQCDDLPLGYAGLFDGNGGVRGAAAWRWHEICGNCEIYERGMGAPVFALMGYAAASLGISRGVACRCLVWLE